MIAHRFSRRGILRGSASLAALAATGRSIAAPAQRLPGRGNFVIRNAHVMTMERDSGDITGGDVHVRDGVIVAVGPKLNAAGAATLSGEGMIVLPGLVETHWHMWNTLLRSMSGEKPETGYFRTTAALGQKCEPSDMYQGTRLAAAEAINSGITFVHDWCHNIRGFDHAEADLKALGETNALVGRRGSPLSRRLLEAVTREYAARFSDGDGKFIANFDIVFLTGWAPHESQQQPARRGSGKVNLGEALRPGRD